MTKVDIILKLFAYDVYVDVCNYLKIEPCGYLEYLKRVLGENKK